MSECIALLLSILGRLLWCGFWIGMVIVAAADAGFGISAGLECDAKCQAPASFQENYHRTLSERAAGESNE